MPPKFIKKLFKLTAKADACVKAEEDLGQEDPPLEEARAILGDEDEARDSSDDTESI